MWRIRVSTLRYRVITVTIGLREYETLNDFHEPAPEAEGPGSRDSAVIVAIVRIGASLDLVTSGLTPEERGALPCGPTGSGPRALAQPRGPAKTAGLGGPRPLARLFAAPGPPAVAVHGILVQPRGMDPRERQRATPPGRPRCRTASGDEPPSRVRGGLSRIAPRVGGPLDRFRLPRRWCRIPWALWPTCTIGGAGRSSREPVRPWKSGWTSPLR